MTNTHERPQFRMVSPPQPGSEAFWTGGRHGQLMIMRCHRCGHFFHPPAPTCWRCRSRDIAPEAVSGRGTVATLTVNQQPWVPGFDPPYIVAMVEVAEEPDVRLISNLVGVPLGDNVIGDCIGMEVEVFFEEWEPLGGGQPVWVPLFRPRGAVS